MRKRKFSSACFCFLSEKKMRSTPDSECVKARREEMRHVALQSGLGTWPGGGVWLPGPGGDLWSKTNTRSGSSALRSPPARFKYSGAGSESVESEVEAEEEMFLQANQLEEERGAEPFSKVVMIQMGRREWRVWKTEGTLSDGRGCGSHLDPPRWLRDKKKSACQCMRWKRHGFDPWVGNMPWRRIWQPTPVFLPGKSHGFQGVVNPLCMGTKELDMTEQTCSLPIYSPYCISASVIYLCLQNILIMFQPQSFCTCHPVTWKTEIFFLHVDEFESLYWICYEIVCFTFCSWGMWDPSSPNRDWTHAPRTGRWDLNHWTTR